MNDIFQSIDSEQIDIWIKNCKQDITILLKSIYKEDVIRNIMTDDDVLRDIFTRIEKRRYYFYVFYNRQDLGEINETALFSFWVMKLMPFKHLNVNTADLNVNIAYFSLINTITYVLNYDDSYKEKSKLILTSIEKRNLLYALKYRDLSKEAIMAIAESLIS